MSPAKKHGTRYRPRRSVLYMASSNEPMPRRPLARRRVPR